MPAIDTAKIAHEICRQHDGTSTAAMDLPPYPSVIERRMDEQSTLAPLAQTPTVARMHEELALLYREQLIAVLKR